ncbi:FixH family protein [Nocardia inohanensis]|uniref:FixH family protein n=1 Tax=Nocardia inohanensis TaxID=209246 RepID=UPI00082DB974|nr:FixH family protein [Nocardia inohanensis]
MTARRALLAAAVLVVAALAAWWLWPSGAGNPESRMAAGPYSVQLSVTAPRTGDNPVDLEITTPQGDSASPDKVSLAPSMPQMGHALPLSTATTVTPGHYRATVNLPMPGQWEITVQVSGPQGSGTATFSVQAN